jgi:hypothetical protein
MDRQMQKTGTNYDPTKYIRGFAVMQGVNVSQLPRLQTNDKKNEKYSYEDYLRSKGQAGNTNHQVNKTTQPVKQDDGKYSFDKYINNKNAQNKDRDSNVSSNTYNEFNKFSNNFSSDNRLQSIDNSNYLNFNLNSNPDEIRKTTIVPQSEYTLFNNDQQAQFGQGDTFNPYSSLTFNEFKPSNNRQVGIGGSTNFNNNLNPMGGNMSSIKNISQFPQMNTQPVRGNTSQMNFSTMGVPYNQTNLTINSNFPKNTHDPNNLKFPK